MDKSLVKILVLVILGLSANVDAQGGCAPEVRVRNTVLRVSRNSPVRIPCPVRFCEEIPTVEWFRYDDGDKRIPVNETSQITITQERLTHEREIISFLGFWSISNSDDGLYRCVASVPIFTLQSHNINISVSDTVLESANGARPPLSVSSSSIGWMPYVIICSGVLSLVMVLVMLIIFLRVHGHTRSRKSIKHTAQYTTAVFTLVTSSSTISEHDEEA